MQLYLSFHWPPCLSLPRYSPNATVPTFFISTPLNHYKTPLPRFALSHYILQRNYFQTYDFGELTHHDYKGRLLFTCIFYLLISGNLLVWIYWPSDDLRFTGSGRKRTRCFQMFEVPIFILHCIYEFCLNYLWGHN